MLSLLDKECHRSCDLTVETLERFVYTMFGINKRRLTTKRQTVKVNVSKRAREVKTPPLPSVNTLRCQKTTRKCFRLALLTIKWAVVLTCIGFVVRGWYSSIKKYSAHQASVSIIVNETERFRYPSVTFCTPFRGGANLVDEISNVAAATNATDISQINLQAIIDRLSYQRTDFLTIFSHPEHGDPRLGLKVLHNDSVWTKTIPHPEYSGMCHTYDPPFTSLAAEWFGIRFGFCFENAENMSRQEKEDQLARTHVYLHEKDVFTFYEQDDRPSSNKLDTSLLRYKTEMPIALKYGRFTRLPTEAIPCESHPGYSFNKCIEKRFSTLRGCQPPWYNFDEFDIPICKNISIIKDKFRLAEVGSTVEKDWTKSRWSTNGLAFETQCPVPCTSGKYFTEISYRRMNLYPWMSDIDDGADWIMYLWFKNFQFQYEQEFMVCDWTCLLGEIGGNLGFFLGGSVLAYLNVVLNPLFQRIQ